MNFDTDSILALTAFCTALASLARALRSLYDTRVSQEDDQKALTALVVVVSLSSPALSAPCRDGKGKFIECPAAAVSPIKCKDAKGKFAKCSAPGAKPVK